MLRWCCLPGSVVLLVLLCGACFAAERPNIVWIFSDDHSFQTIGAYGGPLQHLNPTPNIDRNARQGMRFDRAYVGNSICAPSRGTLLTGKHSHRHGMLTNRTTFDHNQQQFQKILQANGYQTVMVGKIHLDGQMQGFDYWDVLPGQGLYNDPVFVTEAGKTKHKGYVTDVITDKALDWLENKRDESKPFMLMIHHKAAHRPWEPAKRDMKKFADIEIPEPESLFDEFQNRGTPAKNQEMDIASSMILESDLKVGGRYSADGAQYSDRNEWFNEFQPQGRALTQWKYQLYMKDYLRCIWSMDENIGRVLDYLDENQLSDNTVVCYASDQGFYMGEHGWFDKRFMYEESFRTPLVIHWPGKTKPGSVNSDLVQNVDFAETFLDLAAAPIPADMQGRAWCHC